MLARTVICIPPQAVQRALDCSCWVGLCGMGTNVVFKLTVFNQTLAFFPSLKDAGGYVTDEELELRHPTQSQPTSSRKLPPSSLPNSIKMEARPENLAASATSPSKEVLIGGDNNPSRR